MQTLGKKEELGLNKWRAIAKEMPGAAFEGLVVRYFNEGLSEADAILKAREYGGPRYNDFCQRGRPYIKFPTRE